MKITYIVSGIKRAVFFEHTALELVKRGYELDFILVGNHSNDFERFLQNHRFHYSVINVKSWLSYPACIRKIQALLKKTAPDIVHTHLVTANVTGLLAARVAGIKHRVFTRHSGRREKNDWKTMIYDYIIKKNASFAISITNTVRTLLLEQGYPSSAIKVINYGFDIDKFQTPDPEKVARCKYLYNPKNKYPVIGVVSRGVEWKGIQYTIPAFQQLLKKFPNAVLCVFNFSDKDEYAGVINRQLALLPEGSYCKIAFEPDVFNLYQLFDVFVHVPVSEDHEAFGQVYVEALAAGIPSVFTMSGIAKDFIVDKENALKVNFRDSEAILEAVNLVLSDKGLAANLTQYGRKSVAQHFSIQKYIDDLDKFYQSRKQV